MIGIIKKKELFIISYKRKICGEKSKKYIEKKNENENEKRSEYGHCLYFCFTFESISSLVC